MHSLTPKLEYNVRQPPKLHLSLYIHRAPEIQVWAVTLTVVDAVIKLSLKYEKHLLFIKLKNLSPYHMLDSKNKTQGIHSCSPQGCIR